ncbi:hypothetical protein SAMN05216167_101436 [Spirosoma endophyticum]|uniref:DUF4276 family protein n=1 Tax=Spirosoma endophyticum TaxID=662367 RepID=A0A1I1GJH5_9BACT|nr:hypothetical protein SAMN05216167_101436 [Spirosoma endophyticum]
MVKIGFIGEGKTEQILLESASFQEWLQQHGIEPVGAVIDADGAGNLLPDRISPLRIELLSYQADVIVILTDLDNDQSVRVTKQRIGEFIDQVVIVAVKKIESWFLADELTLSTLTNAETKIDYPELVDDPFGEIQQLFLSKTGRGIGTKPMLARRMLKYGFTIEKAAQHPNCPSAHYFLTKLQTLASAN